MNITDFAVIGMILVYLTFQDVSQKRISVWPVLLLTYVSWGNLLFYPQRIYMTLFFFIILWLFKKALAYGDIILIVALIPTMPTYYHTAVFLALIMPITLLFYYFKRDVNPALVPGIFLSWLATTTFLYDIIYSVLI